MLYNEWIMISHGGSWYSFKTCQNRLTKKWQALSSKPSPMLWCLNSFRNAGGAAQNQLFQDTCETTSKGRGLVLSLELTMARRNPWDTINCLNWWDWWPNGKDSSIWRVWWYCSIKTRVQKASCSFFHLLPDDWTDYLWHLAIFCPYPYISSYPLPKSDLWDRTPNISSHAENPRGRILNDADGHIHGGQHASSQPIERLGFS